MVSRDTALVVVEMTSIAHVEKVLAGFLADPEPGVLAIKGEWGVGKTYLWNQFIARQKMVKGYRAYSYASLFGLESIAELRRALFTKQRSLGPARNWFRSCGEKIGSEVTRHMEFDLGLFKGLGLKNTELWAEAIEDRSLRNFIVCLDDLERKDESVTTSALLGFIASLRDERRCKVFLLYNEERAKALESFAPDLAQYREKVIDREIVLQPTVRECYDLVFGGTNYQFPPDPNARATPFDLADARSLPDLFEAMHLANLRVMQKTRVALDYLGTGVATRCPKLWPKFARQAVKLCWLHYCYASSLSLEDILNHRKMVQIHAESVKNPEKAKEFAKYAPLQQVSYYPFPSDKLIVEFLRCGFVDWAAYATLLDKEEAEQARQELGAQYSANWDLLWDNFQVSQPEIIDAHLKFMREHHDSMSLAELSQVVKFLQTFGPQAEAEKFLEEKLDSFVQSNLEADPNDLDLHGVDPEIYSEVKKRLLARIPTKPLSDAFVLLTGSDGWNPGDLRYLATTSSDDFLKWMKTEKSPQLLSCIKKFRERFGNDDKGGPIVAKLDAALHQLAQRSLADAKRVYAGTGLVKPPTDGDAPHA
jgi:hypothetical protein